MYVNYQGKDVGVRVKAATYTTTVSIATRKYMLISSLRTRDDSILVDSKKKQSEFHLSSLRKFTANPS